MSANKDSTIKYRDFLSLREDGAVEVIATDTETKFVLSKGGTSITITYSHGTGTEDMSKEDRINVVRDIIRQVNIPARALQEVKNNLKRIMWTGLFDEGVLDLEEYKRYMGRLYKEEEESTEAE